MSYVVGHVPVEHRRPLGEDQPQPAPVDWMAYLMPAIGVYVAWNAAKTAIKTAAIAGVVWYLSKSAPPAPPA